MFVGTNGNYLAEKENWMTHEREDTARVKSVDKRKGTRSSVEWRKGLSQTGAGTVPHV